MNRNKLKTYAPQARRDFIQAMTDRASFYGITPTKTEAVVVTGDVAVIGGREHPRAVAEKRRKLEARVLKDGFAQTMESMAYTWFNRLVAIRFMELHGYLEHGYRALSHPEGKTTPEILEHAEHIDLPGLKKDRVIDLKLAGDKDGDLYRILLTAQCNALNNAMPFLFERIEDETELLLPDNLLHSDSLIRKLVDGIDEEDWREVEIIGWLYQFYISEKKEAVIGKVVASEDIPAATQLFTPNWIVKYLVQNTLGRQWLATYPTSPIRAQMEYYIEPAEQTPEVQAQLAATTPTTLDPEKITMLDPACGSCHILVEGYDVFKAIYLERGYRLRDIPALILKNNLFGLEIDDRAAQLGAFALMMKARADDRRIFESDAKPNIASFVQSNGLDAGTITAALNSPIRMDVPARNFLFTEIDEAETPLLMLKDAVNRDKFSKSEIEALLDLFENAKSFGSLMMIPDNIANMVPNLERRLKELLVSGDLMSAPARELSPLLHQANMLSRRYDAVVANPPYMGSKGMNSELKKFVNDAYPASKSDLYATFIERVSQLTAAHGLSALITMQSWMFLSSYERLRGKILGDLTIVSMAHLGSRAFDSISGEVVSTTAFVVSKTHLPTYRARFFRLISGASEAEKSGTLRRAIQNAGSNLDYICSAADLFRIPSYPIAYWISAIARDAFELNPLSTIATFRAGLQTGNNDQFLRLWHEVDFGSFFPNCTSREDSVRTLGKWFPHNKGGGFKKWYGNKDYVINWFNDGAEIKEKKRLDLEEGIITANNSKCWNQEFYFREGLTWSSLSTGDFGIRDNGCGSTFDTKGQMLFANSNDTKRLVLLFLNSTVANYFLGALSPTLDYNGGVVSLLPIVHPSSIDLSVADRITEIFKSDWDESEASWEFQRPLLVTYLSRQADIELAYAALRAHWQQMTLHAQQQEKNNNRLFIDAYGLHAEVSDDVPLDRVTLNCNPLFRYPGGLSNQEREDRLRFDTIRELISYMLGCVFGRYSLDEHGLIYGHVGNEKFDRTRYSLFPADDDGIVPNLDRDWGFDDDSTNRLIEFIKVSSSENNLETNLTYVASSLNATNAELPRDTIRHYLATGFYKHHLTFFKRRPIYWLFSSGKQRAFQCLVYLHRYNEGTLSRMRTEYVIPLQGKIAARIEQLESDKVNSTSTSQRKKLQKEQDDLKKQQAELAIFEEKLRHYAEMRISLDLDDGVKVNYGKFGDLLAEVKAITGGKDDE